MFTKIIIFILGLCAILILYLAWTVDGKYAPYLIPIAVLISFFIVFKPQIDYWWAQRYPPKTDARVKMFIEKFYPYYSTLEPSEKSFFLHRVELILKSIEWMPMGFEDIPTDVQYAVACYYARLTQHKKKFLFKYWEKVVLYKHPFPSPMHPKHLHHSEIFEEDNVVLFTIPVLIKGFMDPTEVFPIGLYELVRVYLHSFRPELRFTTESMPNEVFEGITGKDITWPQSSVGLPVLDMEAVAVVCYFIFPENTMKLAPGWYERCNIEFL